MEGGITRFAALFQCRDAGRVGPVRSARTTDPKILLQLSDQPILAFSGAHPKVTAALEEADVLQLTETTGERRVRARRRAIRAAQPLRRDQTALPARQRRPASTSLPHRRSSDSTRTCRLRASVAPSATVAFSSSNVGRVGLGRRSVGPAAGRRADAHGGRCGDRRRQRRDPGGRRHGVRHPRRGRDSRRRRWSSWERVARGSCGTAVSSSAGGGATRSAT